MELTKATKCCSVEGSPARSRSTYAPSKVKNSTPPRILGEGVYRRPPRRAMLLVVQQHSFETESRATALFLCRYPRSIGSPYPWGTLPGPRVPQQAHSGPP